MKKILLLVFLNLLISNELFLDLEGSYIKYYGSHPLHSWVGESKNFIFEINNKNEKNSIFISVKLNSFDSNNENRDSNMLYYTESLRYPNVTFKSNQINFETLNQITSINGMKWFKKLKPKFSFTLKKLFHFKLKEINGNELNILTINELKDLSKKHNLKIFFDNKLCYLIK